MKKKKKRKISKIWLVKKNKFIIPNLYSHFILKYFPFMNSIFSKLHIWRSLNLYLDDEQIWREKFPFVSTYFHLKSWLRSNFFKINIIRIYIFEFQTKFSIFTVCSGKNNLNDILPNVNKFVDFCVPIYFDFIFLFNDRNILYVHFPYIFHLLYRQSK